jgi:hypothetical protein
MTKEVAELSASTALASKDYQGIGMPGLEYMPTTFIPVPRVKLVQSNTQDVLLADGQTEARKGTLYYENLQESQDSLEVAILSAKPLTYTGPSLDDPTKIETKRSIGIIFLDLNQQKVFTMRFTPGSFQSWRSLIGQMVAAHEAGDMATAFSRAVTITTDLVKEGSRSWYVLRFQLGRVLDEEEFATAAQLYETYSGYFNKEETVDEEAA